MNRRSLLLGLGATLAAPAVVRAESLMKLWVPPAPKIITAWDVAAQPSISVGDIMQFVYETGKWKRIGPSDGLTGGPIGVALTQANAYGNATVSLFNGQVLTMPTAAPSGTVVTVRAT